MILVVEDDPLIRELLVEVIDELGYVSVQAADGPAGLAIVETERRVDLLVTDIGLPGLNGRQLADAARAKRADLKVLFLTGYLREPPGSLPCGTAMLQKPFAIDTLTACIREMIGTG